jgi:methylenetetrahydrofolate reductase (NADPH)
MLTPAAGCRRIEIVPFRGVTESVRQHVPRSTVVSVTALPQHEIADTTRVACLLARDGYTVIPHLPARQVRGRRHLSMILSELVDNGIDAVFAIGGDGVGDTDSFADGLSLLEAIRALRGDAMSVGVATYPEGHPYMDPNRVLDVVSAKAPLADYVVTQMCFNASIVVEHLSTLCNAGVDLPVWIGAPGAVRLSRLLAIAARIGIESSLSFVSKGSNRGLLLGRFSPDAFVSEVSQGASDASLRPAGYHWYTFNDFASVPWTHPT